MSYWLLKSEPNTYSINDLYSCRNHRDMWDGVRNYQARNFIRQMEVGDKALFYHSSCPSPGVVGIIEIASSAYPDPTAFDPQDPHYDPKSTTQRPRWFTVDVTYLEKFSNTVTLKEMRQDPLLLDMVILRRGNRLSVTPVDETHYMHILSLGRRTQ